MKFRFCGDADCPDWVLAEINTLSRISSVKLKLLAQIVAQGIVNPPIDVEKAQTLFVESKLDSDIDLKACVACLSYIITSAIRFGCDHNALHSELQQLGLPREHSTSIKRVVVDHNDEITEQFRKASLKVNGLQKASVEYDEEAELVILNVLAEDQKKSVCLSSFTAEVLLENLKLAREKVAELANSSCI